MKWKNSTMDSILRFEFVLPHASGHQRLVRLSFLAHKGSCAFCSHLHTTATLIFLKHHFVKKNAGTLKKSPPILHRPSAVWLQWNDPILFLTSSATNLRIFTDFLFYPTQMQLFLCFLILKEKQEILFHLYLNLKALLSYSSPYKTFFYELSIWISERKKFCVHFVSNLNSSTLNA